MKHIYKRITNKEKIVNKLLGIKESSTKKYWLDVAHKIDKCGTKRERLECIFRLLDDKMAFKYRWIAEVNKLGMESAIEELENC